MHPLLIVLTVLGGLLLLLLLLLLLGHARVRIRCPGKALRVTLSVCGIPFTLLSDAEKEIPDPKDLEHPEALLRRERRRQRRAEKRAEKKRLRAREKAAKRAEQKRAREKGQPTPNLKEKLEMILALLQLLYRETGGKLRLRVRRLHLWVGTDDAAKTAILYGVVLQSATYLLQWIDTHLLRIDRREGAMTVEPDFVSGKCHADIDLTCSIRLYTALVIGVRMLLAFQREKATAMRKAILREKSKTAEKP
ncbi:MAG: DUF2953 domain-containing protein [Clostridia bacterium]|nr:DUF2953 domain-containing protein [Clostridia bacterium]MBQ5661525.1 DUF2953 domain-containing protein [Clostridia bacterium]